MQLFTQNSDLRKTGIYGWTLPAHWVTLSNGERFNTCPNAGVCGAFCYAKQGTYLFSNVRKAHIEKLELVLYNRERWKELMIDELCKPKYKGKFIRIHDAGDFFSDTYALDWIWISSKFPDTTFYTYTKEVSLFKQIKSSIKLPDNFITIYSYGGKEDYLIDPETDRHSDVFPDLEEMLGQGYIDIKDDDKLAAISPNYKIGLYRNNIPQFIKKMGEKKFSEWSMKSDSKKKRDT